MLKTESFGHGTTGCEMRHAFNNYKIIEHIITNYKIKS